MSAHLARQLNVLALLGVGGILAYAFADQVLFSDLPCPLCLLQRVGFALAGFGFALNVIFGSRPSHYGLAIIGALAGAAVAVRQVLLHIVPGSGSYGDPLFGIHFYTWATIAFLAIILGCAGMLLFDRQFHAAADGKPRSDNLSGSREGSRRLALSGLGLAAVLVFGAMVVLNAGSTVLECAFGMCPDNPTDYQLLILPLSERGTPG